MRVSLLLLIRASFPIRCHRVRPLKTWSRYWACPGCESFSRMRASSLESDRAFKKCRFLNHHFPENDDFKTASLHSFYPFTFLPLRLLTLGLWAPANTDYYSLITVHRLLITRQAHASQSLRSPFPWGIVQQSRGISRQDHPISWHHTFLIPGTLELSRQSQITLDQTTHDAKV